MASRARQTDAVLIISALLIAYCIWLIARMSNVEEEVITGVPIVLDIPSRIEAKLTRKTVGIEVRYPKSLRRKVNSGAFEVVVDNRELESEAGIHEFRNVTVPLDDVRRISLPQVVQVGKVQPSHLTILVRYRTIQARVIPAFQGQPAPGYRLLDDRTTGQLEVLLTGSQTSLDKLSGTGGATVYTRPISLTGKKEGFSTSVLVSMPEGVNLLDENATDPDKRVAREAIVSLQVFIEEEVTSRTIRNVPVRIATLSRNLTPRTEPTSGSVTIEGPRSQVESFDAAALSLEPKNPPQESPGFVGKVAIQARRDATYLPGVRIVAVRPEAVLLRYEATATSPTVSP